VLKKDDLFINLLTQTEFLAYARERGRFRQEVLGHVQKHPQATVFVDEVQKIPELLDEVHDLIETHRIRFFLTGSSARKLKRGGANLLAGRAVSLQFFPLTAREIGLSFALEKALRWGSLPLPRLPRASR
jgi:predicted AAA+ superfamily ATPase